MVALLYLPLFSFGYLDLAVACDRGLVILGFPQLELALPTSLRLPVQAGHQPLVGVVIGGVFCQQGRTQTPGRTYGLHTVIVILQCVYQNEREKDPSSCGNCILNNAHLL